MNTRQWRLGLGGDQKRHMSEAACPCQRRRGLPGTLLSALTFIGSQLLLAQIGLIAVIRRHGVANERPMPFPMPATWDDMQAPRGRWSEEPGQSAPAAVEEVDPPVVVEMFANPVIDRNFADPDVIQVGDTFYAYATNTRSPETGVINVQVAKSKDLVNWEWLGDALPVLPRWARKGWTWAPDVTMTADGTRFVMYFVARCRASKKQCIGVATSDRPEGPFVPVGDDEPFIGQIAEGGSIDPNPFVDGDGQRYVLWKNDGNCCGFDTWIYVQRVSEDGLTLEGSPTRLIKADLPWEGNLIEAPIMWRRGGKYYLFYSANGFATARYAVGYAMSESLLGPYAKAPMPLLSTDLQVHRGVGPGGQDIVVDRAGDTWMFYHTWDAERRYRHVNMDVLAWDDGIPVVKRAGNSPQRKP